MQVTPRHTLLLQYMHVFHLMRDLYLVETYLREISSLSVYSN